MNTNVAVQAAENAAYIKFAVGLTYGAVGPPSVRDLDGEATRYVDAALALRLNMAIILLAWNLIRSDFVRYAAFLVLEGLPTRAIGNVTSIFLRYIVVSLR